jgi:hypothetical protein
MKSTTVRCHTIVGDVKSTGNIEGWWTDFISEVTSALKNSVLG